MILMSLKDILKDIDNAQRLRSKACSSNHLFIKPRDSLNSLPARVQTNLQIVPD